MLSLHGALLPDFSEGDHAPMKELTIGRNDAGQRLDRFLAKAVPLLPASLAQKYIRLKRIKCNSARAQRDTRLQEGDVAAVRALVPETTYEACRSLFGAGAPCP